MSSMPVNVRSLVDEWGAHCVVRGGGVQLTNNANLPKIIPSSSGFNKLLIIVVPKI